MAPPGLLQDAQTIFVGQSVHDVAEVIVFGALDGLRSEVIVSHSLNAKMVTQVFRTGHLNIYWFAACHQVFRIKGFDKKKSNSALLFRLLKAHSLS